MVRTPQRERVYHLGEIPEDLCPVSSPQATHCSDVGIVVARTANRSVRGAGYVNRVRPDLWGEGGVIRLTTRQRTLAPRRSVKIFLVLRLCGGTAFGCFR